MRVSVVICTYNRAHSLATLLDSLKYQRHRDFEVVVVNGPSTDDTGDVLATRRQSIRVVDNPVANLSISRNLGIRASAGEVIAFLDDDAIPEPAWLQQASRAFRDANVAGVGGIVFDHTGFALQYRFSTASRFGEPSFSDLAALDSRCLPGGTEFPYLQGTNALFRRSALEEVGLFDETFDFYLDETDLCCRLVDRGFVLLQLADAPVHHKFLPSDRRNEYRVTTSWSSMIRNHVYFGYRHALGVNADEAQVLEHAQRFVDYIIDNAEYHEGLGVVEAGHTERARRACEQGLTDGISLGRARQGVRLPPVKLDRPEFHPYPTHEPGQRIALVVDEFTEALAESARADAASGHEVRVITHAREWPTVDFEDGVWLHRVIDPDAADPMHAALAEFDRVDTWFRPEQTTHLERSRPVMDPQLIMDIGMNNGQDSLFYLRKGFRVVAVEANPILARQCAEELSDYIRSGQLVIENVGLGDQTGTFPFYVNLDNDHWSSFDRAWGTRDGTRYEVIDVPCIKPLDLFNKHGVPYYVKIDIEGHDLMVVRALSELDDRPKYISVEEGGASFFAELWSIGCRRFKIVNQSHNSQIELPTPHREGQHVEHSFEWTSSGPFGDEAPGEWLSFDEAVELYLTQVRSPTRGWMGPEGSWFDIHGRTEARS